MQQYRVQVTQTAKMVAGILLPLLLVIPLVVVLIYFARNDVPDSIVVPTIIVFMLLFFAATWLTVRLFMFKAVIELKENGFGLQFEKRNFVTPPDVDLKMENITNFWVDESRGYRYMSFNTLVKPKVFNLSPASNSSDDIGRFEELVAIVSTMVEDYNNSDTGTPRTISERTMYETWWAKMLAVLLLAMMLMFPVLFFVLPGESSKPVGKYFILVVFGIPFLYKVYQHNFGKK